MVFTSSVVGGVNFERMSQLMIGVMVATVDDFLLVAICVLLTLPNSPAISKPFLKVVNGLFRIISSIKD